MRYIEPHAHMVSRVTDDYRDMLASGCAAVCEPAFWAGFDRSSPQGFYDYFCQLTDYEPKRAAKFGLPHFCWLCINPKESEDTKLADDVIALIPDLLSKPNVLGIGEIGLNKNSRNELLILDAIQNFSTLRPERVIIDHVEEHTAPLVLDRGFWAGITLYPESKATPNRAIDMLELYGPERLWLNSACDWGVSDPLAVPRCILEMKKRQHCAAAIDQIVYQNPRAFLSQSPRFV